MYDLKFDNQISDTDKVFEDAGIKILGTSPDAIDLAEDRERFQDLVKNLNLRQPKNGIAKI